MEKDPINEVFGKPPEAVEQGVPAVTVVELPEGADVPKPKSKGGRPPGAKNRPKGEGALGGKDFIIMLDALLVGLFALFAIRAGKMWELAIDPNTGESEARSTIAVPLARILTRYGIAGPVGAYGDFFLLAIGIMAVVGTRVIIANQLRQKGGGPRESQKEQDVPGVELDTSETTPGFAGSLKDSLPAIR